jgi:catechol 2,3-dioxygenase-like lactoylglutathione lyase family enzyme
MRSEASFRLLVLRAFSLERTLSFYRALGLAFVEERHGAGPTHYACDRDGFVLEIYPSTRDPAVGWDSLGIAVPSIQAAIDALVAEGFMAPPPTPVGGPRAYVRDPDGRTVMLAEEP